MWSYYYFFHARNFFLLLSAGDRLATSSVRQLLSYSFEKLYSSTPPTIVHVHEVLSF